MGAAQIISLAAVRASRQWQGLRAPLHARFAQWLERLQEQWPDPHTPLSEVTAAVWQWRHELTGGLSAPLVAHAHGGERTRQ